MFSEIMYQPDRFIGGDDPATTIRVLAQREHTMMHQNQRLLSLVATLIRQTGGDTIVVTPESQKSVPVRFGIAIRNDEVGNIHLSLVNAASVLPEGVMAPASDESKAPDEAEPKTGETATDEASN